MAPRARPSARFAGAGEGLGAVARPLLVVTTHDGSEGGNGGVAVVHDDGFTGLHPTQVFAQVVFEVGDFYLHVAKLAR